jgi:acetyltransferase-like isoleucine patch superfamily enzyme
MIPRHIQKKWARFWMRYAGTDTPGRTACFFAAWFSPPYKSRSYLARLTKNSFIEPSAVIHHNNLHLNENVFIGDRVAIFKNKKGGNVTIGKGTHIHRDSIIETGFGGTLRIGENTHIQPRCQFSAYKGNIEIGSNVQIAPNCAFYPYDHGYKPEMAIEDQPLHTKGGILIEDGAWIGVSVVVLDGVRIGKGAVIGAGSVVKHDIPSGAVAAGVPAKILLMRDEL